MKVILLTAGRGTRLGPHTFTSPKTLIHVAGRPILDYLLEPFVEIPDFSELICIVGDNGAQIREYVERHYDLPRFIGASGIVEIDGKFITRLIDKSCELI